MNKHQKAKEALLTYIQQAGALREATVSLKVKEHSVEISKRHVEQLRAEVFELAVELNKHDVPAPYPASSTFDALLFVKSFFNELERFKHEAYESQDETQ